MLSQSWSCRAFAVSVSFRRSGGSQMPNQVNVRGGSGAVPIVVRGDSCAIPIIVVRGDSRVGVYWCHAIQIVV
jgi:hypothetical protein